MKTLVLKHVLRRVRRRARPGHGGAVRALDDEERAHEPMAARESATAARKCSPRVATTLGLVGRPSRAAVSPAVALHTRREQRALVPQHTEGR